MGYLFNKKDEKYNNWNRAFPITAQSTNLRENCFFEGLQKIVSSPGEKLNTQNKYLIVCYLVGENFEVLH